MYLNSEWRSGDSKLRQTVRRQRISAGAASASFTAKRSSAYLYCVQLRIDRILGCVLFLAGLGCVNDTSSTKYALRIGFTQGPAVLSYW